MIVAVLVTAVCAVLPHRVAARHDDVSKASAVSQPARTPGASGWCEADYFASQVADGGTNPVNAAVATEFLRTVGGTPDPRRMVDQTIDKLSTGAVTALLTNESLLSEADLAKVGDVKQYAKNLAAIAMQGIYTPKETQPGTAALSLANYTSLCPDQEITSTNSFASDTRKIYATLDVGTSRPDAIVAKWYRSDSQNMLSMARYTVPAEGRFFRVWMLNPQSWDSGNYSVEFYSGDLKLLGEGAFSVQ